jgi:hypothetical protein
MPIRRRGISSRKLQEYGNEKRYRENIVKDYPKVDVKDAPKEMLKRDAASMREQASKAAQKTKKGGK